MKKSLNRLTTLKGFLLGLEMEMDLVEQDIESLTNNLKILNKLKETLEYNINFLKKKGVVATIENYYKSVSELVTVNTKISDTNSSLSKLKQTLKNYLCRIF
jgi:septal ring factor EnvC (AmiA/AmiB activator)